MVAAQKLLDIWGGMALSASIYLGDTLGLYKALYKSGPINSKEFAELTNLDERYIQEWLEGQAAAEIVKYDFDHKKFSLPDDMAASLADETNPGFMGGIFGHILSVARALEKLPQCFKDGSGFSFDQLGPHTKHAQFFDTWYRTALVDKVLPALKDQVLDKLTKGAKVADIGCGSGVALIVLAKQFPCSQFYGYEISQHALEHANQNKILEKINNITFCDSAKTPISEDHSFDLVTSFDCIHDMADPQGMIHTIYNMLKRNGTWFVADLNVKDGFEQNLLHNPLAKYFYAGSLACCLPSGLSKPGGAGLGTLGFSENTAKKMATQAGFHYFKKHDFDNAFNAYYEARPEI